MWQSKFFIDGVGKVQQAQIRESFVQVVAQAKQQGFVVNVWTLCIPVDLSAESLKWRTGWKKRQERGARVRIRLWDRAELEALLLAPDAAHLRAAYFPATQLGRARPPPVLELPEDVVCDDMLFIKQLRAAQIRELGSAKQQFFNVRELHPDVMEAMVKSRSSALGHEQSRP